MENKQIAQILRLLSQLMELHSDNPFKIKSIANAAYKIDKLPYNISTAPLDDIEKIEGLGKSMAAKVIELIQTGSLKEFETLLQNTPTGIVEMLQVKGLGPKKILTIWKDLGIENCGELYYACNENRLIEAKGFGLKTQEEIIKVLEFRMASSGRFLYARVESFAKKLLIQIQNIYQTPVAYVGEYRRCCETMDSLDLLIADSLDKLTDTVLNEVGLSIIEKNAQYITCKNTAGLPVHIKSCAIENFGWKLIEYTGSKNHVNTLALLLIDKEIEEKTEQEIYQLANLSFIEPELREDDEVFKLAKLNELPQLIELTDLRGSLHNHSTWSDGVHTLEKMALYCRDELNLAYLGICDHSKSAFYANGLNEIRVMAQQREIDELNKKLAPFHIFKGIESDILFDGSLDYSDDILKIFDFVVASIHSILKMNEEKATQRLITAIENPHTTILGHPTGRLLLTRSGYPIDHKKVIDACAANQVVIEINANPLRLDLDWRWHQYAIEKGVLLSINPDAHRTTGLLDMHYGTLVARKGGVSAGNCLNTFTLDQIKTYFAKHKQKTHLEKS